MILIILAALLAGSVLVYNKLKKQDIPENQITTAQNTQKKELDAKKVEFNNSIKEILKTDADVDGLSDQDEVKYGTNKDNPDSDNDGLLDKDEIYIYHTDPLKPDTDKDGRTDGYEVRYRTDPNNSKK